jgi:hypothetical protein
LCVGKYDRPRRGSGRRQLGRDVIRGSDGREVVEITAEGPEPRSGAGDGGGELERKRLSRSA